MGWIGVDFDGTLAEYHGWNGGQLGKPIPAMVQRVKKLLAKGTEVRIFTARVACTGKQVAESGKSDNHDFAQEQAAQIEAWCEQHIGQRLAVTATKDFAMIELYDDRAIQVEMNTGKLVAENRDRRSVQALPSGAESYAREMETAILEAFYKLFPVTFTYAGGKASLSTIVFHFLILRGHLEQIASGEERNPVLYAKEGLTLTGSGTVIQDDGLTGE